MAVPTNLYGKSILVGRDPLGRGMLRVRVEGKAVDIAMQPQVPNSVSRLKDSGEAHCKLDVDGGGGVRVTNLKEKNITRVGGVQVVSKAVGEDDVLTLGSEGFTVGVGEILKAAAERFTAKYVCPKCGRFMGNVSYRLLRQNNPGEEMICPGSAKPGYGLTSERRGDPVRKHRGDLSDRPWRVFSAGLAPVKQPTSLPNQL